MNYFSKDDWKINFISKTDDAHRDLFSRGKYLDEKNILKIQIYINLIKITSLSYAIKESEIVLTQMLIVNIKVKL